MAAQWGPGFGVVTGTESPPCLSCRQMLQLLAWPVGWQLQATDSRLGVDERCRSLKQVAANGLDGRWEKADCSHHLRYALMREPRHGEMAEGPDAFGKVALQTSAHHWVLCGLDAMTLQA